MTVRRGYSDSKLSKLLKPREEEEGLDHFLPGFLLKDMNPQDEAEKLRIEIEEENNCNNFFESSDNDDVNFYLSNLSMDDMKEVN